MNGVRVASRLLTETVVTVAAVTRAIVTAVRSAELAADAHRAGRAAQTPIPRPRALGR